MHTIPTRRITHVHTQQHDPLTTHTPCIHTSTHHKLHTPHHIVTSCAWSQFSLVNRVDLQPLADLIANLTGRDRGRGAVGPKELDHALKVSKSTGSSLRYPELLAWLANNNLSSAYESLTKMGFTSADSLRRFRPADVDTMKKMNTHDKRWLLEKIKELHGGE